MNYTESSQKNHLLWIYIYTVISNNNSQFWIAFGRYITLKYVRRGRHLTNEVLSVLRSNFCSNLLMHIVHTNIPFCLKFPMELVLLQNPSPCTKIWFFQGSLRLYMGSRIGYQMYGCSCLQYTSTVVIFHKTQNYKPLSGDQLIFIFRKGDFSEALIWILYLFSYGEEEGGC